MGGQRGAAATNRSTNNSSTRVYETGAFSSNVTPPLNFNSNGSTSTSLGSTTARNGTSLFGGSSRATDFRETRYNVGSPSSSTASEDTLPPYTRLGTTATYDPASLPMTGTRRLSFAASSTLRAALYSDRREEATGRTQSHAGSPPPPAIPDELMAALSLPPGTAINAHSIAAASPSSSFNAAASVSTNLAATESSSPFDNQTDMPWMSTSTSSSLIIDRTDSNRSNTRISSKSSSSSLRKKALLDPSSPYGNCSNQPNSPHIIPASPSPRSTFFAAFPTLSAPGAAMPSMSTASTSISQQQRRSIRKAASAESLRTTSSARDGESAPVHSRRFDGVVESMRGLGIIATTSTISANFLPPLQMDNTAVPIHHAGPSQRQLHQPTRADMKSIWKSFSSKLHIRPIPSPSSSSNNLSVLRGKQTEEGSPSSSLAAPKSREGTLPRKSFENAFRHSLSIYPRRSADKLLAGATPSSTSSHKPNMGNKTERANNNNRDSVVFPEDKQERRLLGRRPSQRKGQNHSSKASLASVPGANSQVSLGEGKTESEYEEEPSWLSRERFTHDLSQRSKKNLRVSSNSSGKAPLSGSHRNDEGNNTIGGKASIMVLSNLQAESEEEEELDDDPLSDDNEDGDDNGADESELASQFSYVDSMDLPDNASSTRLADDEDASVAGSFPPVVLEARRVQLRRNTSPVDLQSGMAASIQRNRADSNVILPPRISTDSAQSATHHQQKGSLEDSAVTSLVSSPPKLTPDTASTVYLDAFSSPLMTGPLSPTQGGPSSFASFPPVSPPPASTDSKGTISSKVSAFTLNPSGPPSPVYTVRPRSMSESFISASFTMRQGGVSISSSNVLEVRASQPNTSNILNASLSHGKIVEEGADAEEQRQGLVGSLSNTPSALPRNGREIGTGNTSVASSLDLTSDHASSLSTMVSASKRDSFIDFEDDSTDEGQELLAASDRSAEDCFFELLPNQQHSRRSKADYTVAMVGGKKVGKSTIIANNLKMSGDKCTVLYEDDDGNKVLSYSGGSSVTGKPCTIDVLEVDMDLLKSTAEGLSWPANVPRPEGVMICYKYCDPKGLEQLKTLLHGFWTRGGIHLIALATQCPPAQGGSTPYKAECDKAAEICNIHGAGLVHLDGGIEDPNRKARNSLQWILRKILESKGQCSRPSSRTRKLVQSKRSTATLLAERTTGKLDAVHVVAKEESADIVRSVSDTGNSLKTVSTTSGNSGLTGDSILDEKFLLSKSGYSQMDIYLSRDDLVQKLLFAAVAGNDEEYISSFLIVYRRFETAYQLLNSWLERFNLGSQHHDDDPLLSRYMQMKLCNLLTYWLRLHPNDFCTSMTAGLLKLVLNKLYALTWVYHYAMEIEELVRATGVVHDQDATWTLPDLQEETPLHARLVAEAAAAERRPSLAPSTDSAISTVSMSESLTTSLEFGTPGTASLDFELAKASNTGSTSVGSFDVSTQSSSHSLQQNQKLAAVLDISNTFLECPVQPLARQITRHAWEVFASMQPRDLLRYVMTPRDPKNPDARPQRNMENPVAKAVSFSNYLSNWTASLLLVQSKQKTRARVFEHLIRLALALRALDNLDCLMAILVGLNSTPVHRLNDLPTAIPEIIYKRFRSMNFLMASTRSFAAYRLALTTARPEVIPYLGVHLQDITRVHDGKSDMRDGLVNWSKMRQIGRYASAIAHCARLTPHYGHDERLSKLVMDVPVFSLDSDDDTLYELSYSYKPRQNRSGSGSQAAKLKRLFKEAIGTPSLSSFNHPAPVLT